MIDTFIDQLKQLNPNEYDPDVDSTLSSLKGFLLITFLLRK